MTKRIVALFVMAVAGCSVAPQDERPGGEEPQVSDEGSALLTALPVKVTNDSAEPVPVTGTVTCAGGCGGGGGALTTVTFFDSTGSVGGSGSGTTDLGYVDVSAYRSVRAFFQELAGSGTAVNLYTCIEPGTCALLSTGFIGTTGEIQSFSLNELGIGFFGRLLRVELVDFTATGDPATTRIVMMGRAY